MQSQNQSEPTGTRNETYDVIAILYHALKGAENCQTYLQDAQDGQIRDFIEQALQAQRQLADQAKEILQQCLQQDTGGRSAFGWGSSEDSSLSEGRSFSQGQSSSFGQNRSSFAEQSSESGADNSNF